jgi:hypothetical protein
LYLKWLPFWWFSGEKRQCTQSCNSALRVDCRRTRGAAADTPRILKANASFCCIWGGTQRRFKVRQSHTVHAHTRQQQHATAASRVRTVETFALICMDLCML